MSERCQLVIGVKQVESPHPEPDGIDHILANPKEYNCIALGERLSGIDEVITLLQPQMSALKTFMTRKYFFNNLKLFLMSPQKSGTHLKVSD
jgi:hypothetical protein